MAPAQVCESVRMVFVCKSPSFCILLLLISLLVLSLFVNDSKSLLFLVNSYQLRICAFCLSHQMGWGEGSGSVGLNFQLKP